MLDDYAASSVVRDHIQLTVDALVAGGFTVEAAHALSLLARDRMLELTEQYRDQMEVTQWEGVIHELNQTLFHEDGCMSASILEKVFFAIIGFRVPHLAHKVAA